MNNAINDFYTSNRKIYDDVKILDGTVDFGSPDIEYISRSGIKKDNQSDAIEIILDLEKLILGTLILSICMTNIWQELP